MAAELRSRGRRHASRGSPRTRVLGLRGLQVPRGAGLGDRRRDQDPDADASSWRLASARSSRGSRRPRRPTATSTPEFGRPGQQPRWSDLEWGHELYCLGHLFQAAVARARTRPGSDDGLLEIATARRRSGLRGLRRRRHRGVLRPRRDRARARRAGAGDRRAALPDAGRALRRAPRARNARRHRVRTLLLPGRHPGARRPTSCAATPCAPTTSRPAPSTSRSRTPTASCSTRSPPSGRTRSRGAPT